MTEENKKVFVVTRNSRIIEDRNYSEKCDADKRAEQLVAVLQQWSSTLIRHNRAVPQPVCIPWPVETKTCLHRHRRRQPWLQTRHLLCQQPRHPLCQQPRKLQH